LILYKFHGAAGTKTRAALYYFVLLKYLIRFKKKVPGEKFSIRPGHQQGCRKILKTRLIKII